MLPTSAQIFSRERTKHTYIAFIDCIIMSTWHSVLNKITVFSTFFNGPRRASRCHIFHYTITSTFLANIYGTAVLGRTIQRTNALKWRKTTCNVVWFPMVFQLEVKYLSPDNFPFFFLQWHSHWRKLRSREALTIQTSLQCSDIWSIHPLQVVFQKCPFVLLLGKR